MSDSVSPCIIACQPPLSMGFPRQEYWSEFPFPSPGDLPHPGIKPESPALAGRFFTTEPPGKPSNPGVRAKLDQWQGWSHRDQQTPRSAKSLWPEGAAPSSKWELSK